MLSGCFKKANTAEMSETGHVLTAPLLRSALFQGSDFPQRSASWDIYLGEMFGDRPNNQISTMYGAHNILLDH